MDIQAYKEGLSGLIADFDFIDGFIIGPDGDMTVMITSYDKLSMFGNQVTSYGEAFRALEKAYAMHSHMGAFRCSTMISRDAPDFIRRRESTYFLRSEDLGRYAPSGAEVIYAR